MDINEPAQTVKTSTALAGPTLHRPGLRVRLAGVVNGAEGSTTRLVLASGLVAAAGALASFA